MTRTDRIDETAARAEPPGPPPATGSCGVVEERVPSPARRLVRLTETKPDGRRLTRYVLSDAPDPAAPSSG